MGQAGRVAARSQRRPGHRSSAQHPGAHPVASWRIRVRGGHTPSVFPPHASGRSRPPGDAAAAPASRASRTGRSTGWRYARNVPRSAPPGCRTAFRRAADRRSVRDSADPRLPLRRTSRGPAARSRTTRLVRCRTTRQCQWERHDFVSAATRNVSSVEGLRRRTVCSGSGD
jgi:hypothetical protein